MCLQKYTKVHSVTLLYAQLQTKKKIHATNANFLSSLYSLHQHDCPQIAVFITMPAKMQNQKNQKQPPRAGISKSTSKFLPRQKKGSAEKFR